MKNRLKTERLILRRWETKDAGQLYLYAKDDRVGPAAGWPVHKSVGDSREIIKEVLDKDGTYAVVLKADKSVVGSVGLMVGKDSNLSISASEAEIGYWIGVPYWGQGLIPEAVRELIRYSFEELNMENLWCGYFEGNEKSRRVQEKCGFVYHHTNKDVHWEMMNDIRTEHVTRLTKAEYLKNNHKTENR